MRKTTNKILLSALASVALFTTPILAETATSLDRFVEVINEDAGLEQNVAADNIVTASESVERMNAILLEAFQAIGATNTGHITLAGMRDVTILKQTIVMNG